MLVFRSFTVGLLGACLYLLGSLHMPPEPTPMPAIDLTQIASFQGSEPPNAVTVIDVAPHVPDAQIAGLVRLRDRERIVAVNDEHVGNDLAAGIQIGEVLRRGNKLLDLTVGGEAAGVRRVLVIVH
jgi:hypothetical protein